MRLLGIVWIYSLFVLGTLSADTLMRVHFIDVGQGNATLFEFPCDAAVLVDTGGEHNGTFDSVNELNEYLEEFFEKHPGLNNRLTSLIITHPHIDHTRGISPILDLHTPKNVITNGQEKGSGKYQQIALHREISRREDTTETSDDIKFFLADLEKIPAGGLTNEIIDPLHVCEGVDPKITLLWGNVKFSSNWKQRGFDFTNGNNHSVVVRIDYGQSSILLTGDLEHDAIPMFLEKHSGTDAINVDVYEVGHHGSINGTTSQLLNRITPQMAVISMGPNEREDSWTAWAYGHPRKEIVYILQNAIPNDSLRLSPITEYVGNRSKSFTQRTIRKAIYATGWDGDFILEAAPDGTWKKLLADSLPHKININTANVSELQELPHIGPRRAQAIFDYRSTNGNFNAIEDILNVSGIGEATLLEIKELITVED